MTDTPAEHGDTPDLTEQERWWLVEATEPWEDALGDNQEFVDEVLVPTVVRILSARSAATPDNAARGFDCSTCRGSGRVERSDMPDGSTRLQVCPVCDGWGRGPSTSAATPDTAAEDTETLARVNGALDALTVSAFLIGPPPWDKVLRRLRDALNPGTRDQGGGA